MLWSRGYGQAIIGSLFPSLLNLLKKFGMAAEGLDNVASGALKALQTGNLSVVAMSMTDEGGGNQELDR